MKIAITGKGGTGKTTLAFYLSRIYAEKNFSVLAVDEDSSLNLAACFGMEGIEPISRIKDLIDKRARISTELVNLNPDVHDLIDKYSVKISDNLALMVLGGISKAGSGCRCPENSLLRALMQELILERNELVVLDVEAGLEIMSRGTLRNIDAILAVTESNYGSICVTKKLLKFSGDLGIEKSYVIANKADNEGLKYISENFEVFHPIPFSSEVQRSSMSPASGAGNIKPVTGEFYRSVDELSEKLLVMQHDGK